MSTNVSSTSSATASAVATANAATTATQSLGKNDFLKLLTAQLQNQDPLQPVDNQQFIAQLAQFSSLEQLQAVGSRLDSLLVAAASQTQLSASSLVGKTVYYNADGVDVAASGAQAAQVSLPSAASVSATIQDASGRTVRVLNLGNQAGGTFDLGWDGRDASGNAVAAGHYTVQLTAKAADGSSVAASLRARGQVGSVAFDGGGAELLIGDSTVKLSDVVQITQS
jgi:flagellar basal-body rod modification protein FlgD